MPVRLALGGGGVVQWAVPPARNSLATEMAAGYRSDRRF